MSYHIEPFSNIYNVDSIKNVFFETSAKKEFTSEQEKDRFCYNYLIQYLEDYPECCFLLLNNKQIYGYIIGMPLTSDNYKKENSYYELFLKELDEFPAHLHINILPEVQGSGQGKALINRFITHLEELSITGLHIITSAHAQNVSFYKACHFNFNKVVTYNGRELLFMGRAINLDT